MGSQQGLDVVVVLHPPPSLSALRPTDMLSREVFFNVEKRHKEQNVEHSKRSSLTEIHSVIQIEIHFWGYCTLNETSQVDLDDDKPRKVSFPTEDAYPA